MAGQSDLGTDPLNIVKGAEKRFNQDRDFDAVYAVFDRDEHHKPNYENAFSYAENLELTKRLEGSRKKQKIPLECIVSVPCFELWFLLHFEERYALCHRDEITTRLKRHISDYHKGKVGMYGATEERFEIAAARAQRLKEKHVETRRQGTELYTDVHDLTERLRKMRPR